MIMSDLIHSFETGGRGFVHRLKMNLECSFYNLVLVVLYFEARMFLREKLDLHSLGTDCKIYISPIFCFSFLIYDIRCAVNGYKDVRHSSMSKNDFMHNQYWHILGELMSAFDVQKGIQP
jgi:hypothetical protein